MDMSGTAPGTPARPTRRGRESPSVTPLLPLLLLEAMRDRDRPEEVLEDEDITSSMPRRLGLSEVVRVQIDRFEKEVKQRRPQLPSQVEDLLRLVIRRPDCEEIFSATGRRLSERYWRERSGFMRGLIRLLPRPLALISAQRAGKRMLRDLAGNSRLSLTRRPVALSINSTMTARADPGGAACALYTGALTSLLELYTGRKYRVTHERCGGAGGGACAWAVEIAG